MAKKSLKKENSYATELYKDKAINELILFSMYLLEKDLESCTFEIIFKKCFTLFPNSFCFDNSPEWPDSRKLDRPLRELRERKMITGDPKTSYFLTKTGRKNIEETTKAFGQKKLF